MREFQTTILERKTKITDGHVTEPMEAAWAGEAIFYIQLFEPISDKIRLAVHAQISPDGIRWVDEGMAIEPPKKPGLYFLRVSHFGGWLRLLFTIKPESGSAIITTHLVLKE
jgi:hypothetical protein